MTQVANSRRVLFVLGELTHSGLEKMLEASAGLWQAAGLQPHILATGAKPGDFAPRLEACGYTLHHIPFARSPHFIAALLAFQRRHGFEIVHIHTEQAAFWHALAARLARSDTRLFRTVHAVFRFDGLLRWRRLLQRWLMRRLLHVGFTAPSPSVAAHEAAIFRNPMPVLPNWLSLQPPFTPAWRAEARSALAIDDATFVIASVGNCEDTKNHRALLEALAALPGDRPWLYLHVGSSAEEAGEQALAAQLGIAGRCRFLGRRPATEIFAAADLFAMPSKQEGFGLAAAEALSMGLPCVLSDVPGLRDFSPYAAAISWCDPQSPATITAAILARLQAPLRHPAIAGEIRNALAADAGVRRFTVLYAGNGSQDT